jgi:cyclopropane-fatty-acyl-phospholipid synthase
MDQPDVVPGWAKPQWWLRYLARHLRQFNARSRARNNVAHHYDLDGRLYSLFLDSDKQYSCAYFETPDMALDDAQLAKKRHIAAKLLIRPGDRVLDIGSGWGGLGLYLAETAGANVTGVTLSTEQLQVSNARAAEKKLAQSAKFVLEDYRDIPGPFDRIVSSACWNMSVSISTIPISSGVRSFSPTTASCCFTRSAGRRGPM